MCGHEGCIPVASHIDKLDTGISIIFLGRKHLKLRLGLNERYLFFRQQNLLRHDCCFDGSCSLFVSVFVHEACDVMNIFPHLKHIATGNRQTIVSQRNILYEFI